MTQGTNLIPKSARRGSKAKPSVLMVAKTLFPDSYGGLCRGVFEIANRLTEDGFPVTVLHLRKCSSGGSDLWHFKTQPYSVGGVTRFLPGDMRLLIPAFAGYRRIMRHTEFDVVLSFHSLAGLLCYLHAAMRRIPVVSFFAAPGFLDWLSDKRDVSSRNVSFWARAAFSIKLLSGSRISRCLEHLTLRVSTLVLALSRYSLSTIEQYFPDILARARVCYWGVDVTTFRPARNEEEKQLCRESLGFSSDSQIVLSVRRLVPRMGLDVLIDAFSLVARESKHAVLLIAGDGPLRKQLEQQVSQLDCRARIRFLGLVPEEMLPPLYRAADLFVVPTLELEGLGLVTLEALASGIPVIGTDVAGTREILEQVERKCLIKNLEPGLLAQGLMDILRLTENKRQALGEKGRELAEKVFAWDSVVRNVESHLEDIRQHG